MEIKINSTKMMKKILEERNQDYNNWKSSVIEKNIGQVFDSKSKLRKKIDALILEEESKEMIEKYMRNKGIEL